MTGSNTATGVSRPDLPTCQTTSRKVVSAVMCENL